LVAFEMASQLAAGGEEIALLALFSSYLRHPGAMAAPVRSRDIVVEFLREHDLKVDPAMLGGGSSPQLLRSAFDQAKESGLVPSTLDLHEFTRVMARHGRAYRLHVRMARRYIPQPRRARIVLFEAQDRSQDGPGPFADWDRIASSVARHEVSGDHFTMLRPPNVRQLAGHLTAYLLSDRLDRRPLSRHETST